MRRIAMCNAAGVAACLVLVALVAGCRVNVDKGANGEDKNVRIDTPFGGIHVDTDQTTAADLGLPVYPGAQQVAGDDNHKSADVHMGFGEWEFRVRAVSYSTADKQDQVVDFYKKALGRYGDVIVCQHNAPVGTPATTSQGLTCTGGKKDLDMHVHESGYDIGKGNLELKAGSPRHQHIVGFETPRNSQTRFALIALDLPTAVESDSGKSD